MVENQDIMDMMLEYENSFDLKTYHLAVDGKVLAIAFFISFRHTSTVWYQ